MADRKEYNATYYGKNKDELLEKKRARYHSDPEYRQRQIEAARAYRKKVSENKPPITVEYGDSRAFAYRVRVLAERVNRSVSTINHWQRLGVLPQTPFYSDGGHRLYTDDMITVVSQVLSMMPKPSSDEAAFRAAILTGWKNMGIPEE